MGAGQWLNSEDNEMRKAAGILVSVVTVLLVYGASQPVLGGLTFGIVAIFGLGESAAESLADIMTILGLIPLWFAATIPYRLINIPDDVNRTKRTRAGSIMRGLLIGIFYLSILFLSLIGQAQKSPLKASEGEQLEPPFGEQTVRRLMESAREIEKLAESPAAYSQLRGRAMLRCSALFYLIDENAQRYAQKRRFRADEEIDGLSYLSASFFENGGVEVSQEMSLEYFESYVAVYRDWINKNGVSSEDMEDTSHPLGNEWNACSIYGRAALDWVDQNAEALFGPSSNVE